MAKLYQSTGRPAEARAALALALEGFAPTDEMPEIAEAQALLVAIEADAHAVLAPALEGFAPTPEMPEIAEAQALLVVIEAGAHVRRE